MFPAAQVTTLTRLMWVVPGAALALTALAALAWRRRFWSVPWRAHYSAVAGAAVVLSGWLAFWRLLALP